MDRPHHADLGCCSGNDGLHQRRNAASSLRVLLGIAEAGFFPGIIFYLTLWFPEVYRARIVGFFMAAIPLSTVIGAPLSGWLLSLHGGLGLQGWQWLFIVESLPPVILSAVVFVYLTDVQPARRGSSRKNATGSPPGWRRKGDSARRCANRAWRGPGGSQGAAAQPGLFRRGRDELWAELLPAADRQGLRVVERQTGLVSPLPYVSAWSAWWGGDAAPTAAERRFHLAFPIFVARRASPPPR